MIDASMRPLSVRMPARSRGWVLIGERGWKKFRPL